MTRASLPTYLAVAALAACSNSASPPAPVQMRDAAAAPGPADASSAPAVAPRASIVVPTFALGGRTYVEADAWFELPAPDASALLSWATGPVSQVQLALEPGDRAVKLQAATAAPARWRSVIGTTLPGYRADGRACEATIAGLYVLGYGYSDDLDENSDFGGGARWIAELAHPPGCAPVLVTNRPAPSFNTPASPASADERRALVAAFRGIARAAAANEPPTIRVFERAGQRLAMVTMETSFTNENGCGEQYIGRRAIFELVAAAPPQLRSQTRASFGDAPVVALFDSDGDGLAEATLGQARFDHGDHGRVVLVSSLDFHHDPAGEDDTAAYQFGFGYYFGCD